MKRTREWWAALTVEERRGLVATERELKHWTICYPSPQESSDRKNYMNYRDTLIAKADAAMIPFADNAAKEDVDESEKV
jgi:hypothetical protein